MFDGGFAHLTMAEIAARANCSLRTLYSLAPSRDELVLVSSTATSGGWVARHGGHRPAMAPLDALQAYLARRLRQSKG